MDRHLVTIEVSVISCANEWVNTNRITFNQHRLEGLNRKTEFLRGKYDIAVVAEVSSFEDAAAVKVLVVASGALDRLEMMEYIDMNDIATRASKITGAYRAPGG